MKKLSAKQCIGQRMCELTINLCFHMITSGIILGHFKTQKSLSDQQIYPHNNSREVHDKLQSP